MPKSFLRINSMFFFKTEIIDVDFLATFASWRFKLLLKAFYE